nr:NUDIX domain-containing protein [Candidatus Paceibacterota bacterium]
GTYRTELVPELEGFSGTEERAKCLSSKSSTAAYREGVVHGYMSRLKVTRPMVDIAVLKRREGMVLLGGKPTDPPDQWRFPGGLVDPTDPTLEYAAKREAGEELSNIEIDDVTYIGSTSVNDRRYRGTGEYAITAMCIASYIFGAARPGDDLSRVEWFPIAKLPKVLVPEHRKLGEMLSNYLSRA